MVDVVYGWDSRFCTEFYGGLFCFVCNLGFKNLWPVSNSLSEGVCGGQPNARRRPVGSVDEEIQ